MNIKVYRISLIGIPSSQIRLKYHVCYAENLSWVMPYRKQDLICPSFLLPFPRCKVIHNAVNDVGKKLSLQNLYPNHARLEMF